MFKRLTWWIESVFGSVFLAVLLTLATLAVLFL